jgi:hypothetical protein
MVVVAAAAVPVGVNVTPSGPLLLHVKTAEPAASPVAVTDAVAVTVDIVGALLGLRTPISGVDGVPETAGDGALDDAPLDAVRE